MNFSGGYKFAFLARHIAYFLSRAGLGEIRCHNCHEIFFPGSIPETSARPGSTIASPCEGKNIPASFPLLCPDCQTLLQPYAGNRCISCGVPLAPGMPGNLCGICVDHSPPWDHVAYHSLYEGALRDLLIRFKFNGQLYLAKLFATFLVEACKCLVKPDYIIPVPQHPQKLRKRGFNQANEICRIFSRFTGIPSRPDLLAKTRSTQPQEGLSREERQLNLKGAFHASPAVSGCHIWLVDDVLTTGSTCAECAGTLKLAGAKHMDILCVGRTPPP